MKFDTRKVHLELMARCRQVLDEYNMTEVQTISAGAGTFYVWVSESMHSIQCQRRLTIYVELFHETVVE